VLNLPHAVTGLSPFRLEKFNAGIDSGKLRSLG
jgi:hypothetical protein